MHTFDGFITRSLFWKLFVWVSAILALTIIVTIWTTATVKRQAETTRYLTVQARQFAPAAVAIYEERGPTALRHWFSEIEQIGNIQRRYTLLNVQGKNVLSGAVPEKLDALLQRVDAGELRLPTKEPLNGIYMGSAVGANGDRYYLATTITKWDPWRTPQILYSARDIFISRFVVILLIVGALLFLVARFLISRPVEHLRKATSSLAAGDFRVRVSDSLGNRVDEIAALARDFDQMAEHLQAMIIAHRTLLGDVSHELRSPLARIEAALGLMRQKKAKGVDVELEVERIERETGLLDDLIGALLSLSRLEAQTKLNHKEPVDLKTLVSNIIHDAEFEAHSLNRSVVAQNFEPVILYGDKDLLHGAIENVIRNAIRCTPQNSLVRVSMSVRHDDSNDQVIITVRDSGPGVPPGELEKLFEPFVRITDAHGRQYDGFGLGLAIARRAVYLHGGAITAENLPAGGLMVRISLPCQPCSLPETKTEDIVVPLPETQLRPRTTDGDSDDVDYPAA